MSVATLRFDRPAADLRGASDADVLKAIAWRRGSNPQLVRAARGGDADAFRDALLRSANQLRRSRSPMPAGRCAVLWSRQAFPPTDRATALVEIYENLPVAGEDRSSKASRAGQRRKTTEFADLHEWLSAAQAGPPLSPLEWLMLAEIWRDAAADLRADTWALWRTLLAGALELSVQLDEPVGSQATDDQRLLIGGELPWTIGLLFADLHGADALRRRGQRFLRESLLEQTDTDGTPRAEILERFGFWLAALTRAAEWGRRAGVELLDAAASRRFRALVKMASPLCGLDGRLALSNGYVENRIPLLECALVHGGWTKQQVPLQHLRALAMSSTAAPARSPVERRLKKSDVLPAVQSDWARVGCLRSDWTTTADRLVVAHHQPLPQIELAAFGRLLFSGEWGLEVAIGGEPLTLEAEWSCVCWNSDEDADYLELQMPLDDGLRIERQLLLSRTDHFALLADCIAGAGSERIDYRSHLPLSAGTTAEADTETRQCRLRRDKLQARCFPLALPQDRIQSTSGAFEARPLALELRQAAIGGLYAPVVIDWHPDRRRTEAQWRTLTVSEDGRTLKTDTAAGHRLRIGAHQLLVYRSVVRSELHRAVLGHHTLHETVVGRFDANGEVTPLLMVE